MLKVLIGAGCFWGIEEYFRKLNGVADTKVGYSGGGFDNPTYEEVCNGNTEHVEVVLISFDEKIISYRKIIDNFWLCHDPTQLDRQGFDVGRQYRSVIFYHSNKEKLIANESKKEIQNNFSQKIVTEITEAKKFYIAEEYHQLYIFKRTNNGG